MKRKNVYLILIIAAGLSGWFWIRYYNKQTSEKDRVSFDVQQVNEIDKIFLSNRMDGHILLEKKKDKWTVNGKYEVFPPAIDLFLNETVRKIRVKGTVPLAARDNVIAAMASTATKVEIYAGGEPVKIYYVGQPTSDLTGTYMYLEGSPDPYITHIPGFEGYLSSRYPMDIREWMNKVIFDYKAEDIQAVEVNYPADVNSSFTISRSEKQGDFDVSVAENAPSEALNYAAVKSYFGLFKFKYCEGFVDFENNKLDSILRSRPYCTISVTDKKNNIRRLRVYLREAGERSHGLTDKNGNRLTTDPSRYNAVMNDDRQVMVIQDMVFSPIMIKYSDLFSRNR